MNSLRRLHDFGQSPWYDNIHRKMLTSGELERMIQEDGVKGITSNPTIFQNAISKSSDYDDQIKQLLEEDPSKSSRDLFFSLAITDIQSAADLLLPIYKESHGIDGMVSLEVSPDLAYNADKTVLEALQLVKRVNRPNLMIKVPATREGLSAIETLTSEGISINATLLFSSKRYKEVLEAYLLGLETRLRRGQPIDNISSVASFFISRVDAMVDKLLDQKMETADHHTKIQLQSLKGKIAISNAKLSYQHYKKVSNSQRGKDLVESGAKMQRLLWASTGTKNPDYSDVLYVDTLIGADTVNTIPPATFETYKDHGNPQATLETDLELAKNSIDLLKNLGIDLNRITDTLEDEGVKSFSESFDTLLNAIQKKADVINELQTASA
ncbi:MAG: transaldolase [Gammaproteobacteria bacterium]|nr:transaldolase [Gammaproteobacteria bacterium]